MGTDKQPEYALVFAGAGDVDLMDMTIEKMVSRIRSEKKTLEKVKEAIEETVLHVHARHIMADPYEPKPMFSLLIGIWTRDTHAQLLKTSSTAVARVDKFECIGTGHSLASYLADTLAFKTMTTRNAELLCAYILKRAKQYAPYCGGESNVLTLTNDGKANALSLDAIGEKEYLFQHLESAFRYFRYFFSEPRTEKEIKETIEKLERQLLKIMNQPKARLEKRHLKIRSKIKGNKNLPRFVVFRSNLHIYGMLVDDETGKTLVSVADKSINKKDLNKTQKAKETGKLIAEKAVKEKIRKIVFDRSGYRYHGRVKALADGAREGGLKF